MLLYNLCWMVIKFTFTREFLWNAWRQEHQGLFRGFCRWFPSLQTLLPLTSPAPDLTMPLLLQLLPDLSNILTYILQNFTNSANPTLPSTSGYYTRNKHANTRTMPTTYNTYSHKQHNPCQPTKARTTRGTQAHQYRHASLFTVIYG